MTHDKKSSPERNDWQQHKACNSQVHLVLLFLVVLHFEVVVLVLVVIVDMAFEITIWYEINVASHERRMKQVVVSMSHCSNGFIVVRVLMIM